MLFQLLWSWADKNLGVIHNVTLIIEYLIYSDRHMCKQYRPLEIYMYMDLLATVGKQITSYFNLKYSQDKFSRQQTDTTFLCFPQWKKQQNI